MLPPPDPSKIEEPADPRWADPQVAILPWTHPGKELEVIGYGWSPQISPQGRMIYYAYQAKPISGKRILAETEEGNDIREYDRQTKTSRVLFRQEKGYLDEPLLSPDGKQLAFSLCDSVNGSYAESIGLGIYDLEKNTGHVLIPEHRHQGTRNFISAVFWTNKVPYQLIACAEIPVFKNAKEQHDPNDLADTYRSKIVNVTAGRLIYSGLHDICVQPANDFRVLAFPTPSSDNIWVCYHKWLTFNANSGKEVVPSRPLNLGPKGFLSPNGLYCAELVGVDKRTLSVRKIGDSRHSWQWQNEDDEIREMVWSHDCTKLLIVINRGQLSCEELLVLKRPI